MESAVPAADLAENMVQTILLATSIAANIMKTAILAAGLAENIIRTIIVATSIAENIMKTAIHSNRHCRKQCESNYSSNINNGIRELVWHQTMAQRLLQKYVCTSRIRFNVMSGR